MSLLERILTASFDRYATFIEKHGIEKKWEKVLKVSAQVAQQVIFIDYKKLKQKRLEFYRSIGDQTPSTEAKENYAQILAGADCSNIITARVWQMLWLTVPYAVFLFPETRNAAYYVGVPSASVGSIHLSYYMTMGLNIKNVEWWINFLGNQSYQKKAAAGKETEVK